MNSNLLKFRSSVIVLIRIAELGFVFFLILMGISFLMDHFEELPMRKEQIIADPTIRNVMGESFEGTVTHDLDTGAVTIVVPANCEFAKGVADALGNNDPSSASIKLQKLSLVRGNTHYTVRFVDTPRK